ncbi:hypothetical protein M2418_000427 [Rhizobium sp. BIGb0125]|uniref:hypothetical protein n=1 Tax=Rhizobium sp. BIGb0125 TaxID=2940618 RepID=UPI00216A0F27|nr:hypothetical protein [Rhizobium sp. BIGb0125]MCS4240925.1 hypothetical protein [Rhizobium sp. BIGb0125]
MQRLAFLFVIFIAGPTSALAFCSQPFGSVMLPSVPGTLYKPSAPYCLSGYKYSKTHTCADWEITRYQNEVDEYLEKLRDYANDAVQVANQAITFANAAKAYAKCESQNVIDELN